MLELPTLDLHWTLTILAGVAALVSLGVTHVLKLGLSGWLRTHPDAMAPWFWDATLRLTSILLGGAVGLLLMTNVVGFGLGAASGAINTLIVWLIKKRVRKLAGVEDTLPPNGDLTLSNLKD